jgi:hypothetical protein
MKIGSKHAHVAIIVIAVVSLIFTLWLVYNEIADPPYCPRIFYIPACYLVFVAYSLVIISEFIKKREANILMYLGGAGLGFVLAVWFSFNHIAGLERCPIFFGIPMCYASLLACSVLIVIKMVLIHKDMPLSLR